MFKDAKRYSFLGIIISLPIILPVLLSSNLLAQTAALETTMTLQQVDGITIPFQNGIPLPSYEKQNRKIIDLAGTWKKERRTADNNITLSKRDSAGYANLIAESGGRYLAGYDDSSWETKNLPAVENQMHPYPTIPEFFYDGVWYRRSFEVDAADSGKFVKLVLLAVNYVADVWVNGEYLGYHEGGYTPFAFDVSPALKYGQTNVIAVRVDLIPWGERNDIIPYNTVDWFNYAGVIHDVYLEFAEPVSIIRNDIIPLNLDGDIQSTIVLHNIKPTAANVDVTIQVYEASIDTGNIDTEFSYQLAGTEIFVSGTNQNSLTVQPDLTSVWRTSIKIDNPKLWTPKQPNLYIMKVTLKEGSSIIDEFSSQFGIRTVSTSGNKFLLNNRVVFLTGAARHEDHPVYGRAIPQEAIFNDLKIVKSLNVNFLRTAHYPNHPYTYLILDRLGITAMEEIPVYWFDENEPWQIQNNVRKLHIQMFREMVFKDYNRPSVILWSTSNECHEETNRIIYNQMVMDDIRQNYDDHRLVSQSSAADNPGAADITQGPLDVAGWTMYFGIFHGSTYFTGTYNFINQAKNNFPNKPIIDTEFGYWSSENNTTEQKQIDVFNNTFLAFKQHAALNSSGTINANGPLMACTWWTVFDWYRMSTSLQTMGLYKMDRVTAKPVAAVLKSAYSPYYNFDGVLTDINDEIRIAPDKFELMQNYPNPFNPVTKIKYTIQTPPTSSPLVKGRTEEGFVTLKVYDVLGNEIATLVDEYKPAGRYEVEFDGSRLTSGIYFYQLSVSAWPSQDGKAGSQVSTKKLVLLK
jgi:beta-glucuronidase